MDCGYHEIDYSKQLPNETLLGKGNGLIEEREVYEYVLENYEKYSKIVEGITGRPIPWVLDDQDSKTTFDAKIRSKTQVAINNLVRILEDQKLSPMTEEYQEKLAVGLFYFADFPDNQAAIQEHRTAILKQTAELKRVGLERFQTILFEMGGLGTSLMDKDAPMEATAIGALKMKRGWCTEKSKILFAVFKLARLKPHFVMSKDQGKDLNQKLKDLGITPLKSSKVAHTYIGVSLGQRYRFFDLALFQSNAQYPNFYPQRLIHYFAGDKMNQAINLEDRGKLSEAITAFREAIHFDPKLGMIFADLGDALAQQGKLDEAISNYNDAIRLDPSSIAYYNLGNALRDQGKLDDAILAFRRAVELDPQDADVHFNLAYSLAQEGRHDEAIAAYHEAIRFNPKNADAFENLGLILYEEGRVDEAIISYREAIRLNAKDASAYFRLSIALRKQGKLDESIVTLRKIIQINPSNVNAYLDLGISLMLQGKLDSSIATLRKALRLDPGNLKAQQLLANAMKLKSKKKD